jgi:UDP-3-O-[3-hydroxymyristoyl] N-acetylglucosamine deacetylase/3-hydroxyacyl-[acyl-carrier-protein] dehydratase
MPEIRIEEILERIPHRYPMIMVDRVIDYDETHIVAIKNLTINEPFFQGHFPDQPVMPGVLQLEAMAQAGGILIVKNCDIKEPATYFMSIDKAKFRKMVGPGDQLRIEAHLVRMKSKTARFKATIHVGDELISEAELMCMIVSRDEVER